MVKPKKMKFEVQENETISQCLDRIKAEGYVPVSRMEKPLFEEVKEAGKTVYNPIGRQIVFEAKIVD